MDQKKTPYLDAFLAVRVSLNAVSLKNLAQTFSNSTYSEKYKAFEFDNHPLRRRRILQAYF